MSLPLTREACLHICAPISLWGKPLAENKGIRKAVAENDGFDFAVQNDDVVDDA